MVWMGCWGVSTIWIREEFLSSIKVGDTFSMFNDIYHFFVSGPVAVHRKCSVGTFTVGTRKGIGGAIYSVMASSTTFPASWRTSAIFFGMSKTAAIRAFYRVRVVPIHLILTTSYSDIGGASGAEKS